MITLTKLCQLTGVTRRMLQDYAAIGLLRPRERTPGGYWLYHEEDVLRLCALQLLRRGGFSRSELLEVFPDPQLPLEEMLAQASGALAARRRQLDQLEESLHSLSQQAAAFRQPTPAVPVRTEDAPQEDAYSAM